MTVAWYPLARDCGHPSPESKRCKGGKIGEDLYAGMDPYHTFEGGEADEEDAKRHEKDKGSTHKGGMDDENIMEIRQMSLC